LILSAKPSCAKNSRKAWAVVAKPVGTRTPVGNCEIISPRLAFLPPTDSTSVIRSFSKGTTKAVGLKSAVIDKLQKLKRVRPRSAATLVFFEGVESLRGEIWIIRGL